MSRGWKGFSTPKKKFCFDETRRRQVERTPVDAVSQSCEAGWSSTIWTPRSLIHSCIQGSSPRADTKRIRARPRCRNEVRGMKKKIEEYLTHKIPPPPIATALGLTLVHAGNGTAVFEYVADGRHANPMGTLHGGILCDLADAAMGIALASTLAEGESFTTLELQINFLRPVWNAKLTAR